MAYGVRCHGTNKQPSKLEEEPKSRPDPMEVSEGNIDGDSDSMTEGKVRGDGAGIGSVMFGLGNSFIF